MVPFFCTAFPSERIGTIAEVIGVRDDARARDSRWIEKHFVGIVEHRGVLNRRHGDRGENACHYLHTSAHRKSFISGYPIS